MDDGYAMVYHLSSIIRYPYSMFSLHVIQKQIKDHHVNLLSIRFNKIRIIAGTGHVLFVRRAA